MRNFNDPNQKKANLVLQAQEKMRELKDAQLAMETAEDNLNKAQESVQETPASTDFDKVIQASRVTAAAQEFDEAQVKYASLLSLMPSFQKDMHKKRSALYH